MPISEMPSTRNNGSGLERPRLEAGRLVQKPHVNTEEK